MIKEYVIAALVFLLLMLSVFHFWIEPLRRNDIEIIRLIAQHQQQRGPASAPRQGADLPIP